MNQKSRQGNLGYLVKFHFDFFISIFLTEIIYIFKLLFQFKVSFEFSNLIVIFVTIFSVNFTVFAISKYLLKNYNKIGDAQIRKNIDAVFITPIKTSIMGVIILLFLSTFRGSFLDNFNFFAYFLVFYSIFSSYYAFKLVYEISIHQGND